MAALYFRNLPPRRPAHRSGLPSRARPPDARSFPASAQQGFSPGRDIHNAVGAGFRFFLRSVAIPLIGFDAGYGIEARHWQFFLVIGA